MKKRKLITPEERDLFLDGVRREGSIKAGAGQVHVNVRTARRRLRADPEFQARFDAAKAEAMVGFWVRAGCPRNPGKALAPQPGGVFNAARGRRVPATCRMTPELIDRFVHGVETTGIIKQAAALAGISQSTATRWCNIRRIKSRVRRAQARYCKAHPEVSPAERKPAAGRAASARIWAAMEESPQSADAGIAAEVKASLAAMRESPAVFFSRVLGWEPWAKQLEIAEALRDGIMGRGPKRIAVRSGNGVGKTALAARIMLWVLRCWPNSVVITTAPTDRQVNELMWREARAAHLGARVPLGGTMYRRQARWEIGPQHFALGLSPDNTRPERFQGFHAGLIVFVIDEASGVPPAHWEAIKGSALAGNTVLFAIGNPTRTHGEFFDIFHGKQDIWKTMAVSAFDTPNFTVGPGAVPGLVGPEAVEEARKDWGEGSSLWDVRILGKFPTGAGNSLFHLDWLESAKSVEAEDGPYALGVDVARSGNDETVLILLKGNRFEKMDVWRGQDPMKTAGRVREYADTHAGIRIAIDDGGVGGGVVDRLREQNVSLDAISFGAAPRGKMAASRFRNRMSEMYWVLAEELRQKRLMMPHVPRLWAQLSQIEWELESDKAIRVHKRGIGAQAPSPDLADALALAMEARKSADRGIGIWL